MQETNEKKIRQNLIALVDLTNNVEDVVKILKDKEIVSGDDEETILRAESPFDRKSQFYWLITKKDNSAFEELVSALKSTGNDQAASKLLEPLEEKEEESTGQEAKVIQAEVTVETVQQPDQEGIDFAEEIEKEFERIQTEQEAADKMEAETVEEYESVESAVSPSHNEKEEQIQTQPETVEIDDDEGLESDIQVKITPAESEPEETEVVDDGVETEVEEVIPASPMVELENLELNEDDVQGEPEVEVAQKVTEQPEPEVITTPAPEPTYVTGNAQDENEDEPVKTRRQVQFDTYNENGNNKRNDHEESGSGGEESSSPNIRKSIVQLNKEKFEQNAPAGVKVKYSFRKEEPVETPKESTVKNLRNFFQKLGSVDGGDSTPAKLGGVHPNRKSMAS